MNKTWLARITYAFVCNIPVCFFLCFTSNVVNNGGQFVFLNFIFNYLISLPIAICISLFIPLVNWGRKFTKIFNVDNKTFTHNFKYRVIATFLYTCIYFAILNPILALTNNLVYSTWVPLNEYLFNLARTIPLMIMVGFSSSLLFDIPAYKLAHKIDKSF